MSYCAIDWARAAISMYTHSFDRTFFLNDRFFIFTHLVSLVIITVKVIMYASRG